MSPVRTPHPLSTPQPTPDLAERLALALRALHAASALVLSHYSPRGCRADTKADGSPVTVADLAAEDLLRDFFARHAPADSFLGEERGQTGHLSAPFRWVVDPIDGTRSFVHGVPLFGCMIALQHEGRNVLGCVALPALHEAVFAARGLGCWHTRLDPAAPELTTDAAIPARVSSVTALYNATLTITCPRLLMAADAAWYTKLNSVVKESRTWGDCYGHLLVATGRADVMIDSPMKEWDVAAIEPIITEAGGIMTDWDHGAPTNGHRGAVSAATAPLLTATLAMRSPAAR